METRLEKVPPPKKKKKSGFLSYVSMTGMRKRQQRRLKSGTQTIRMPGGNAARGCGVDISYSFIDRFISFPREALTFSVCWSLAVTAAATTPPIRYRNLA